MSLGSVDDAERLAWERTPEPGWIDSPSGPLFAWYHPPRAPVRSRAVLLCDPLMSDRMNLHLTYRHLALRLSARGYPTLRFDYPGTGDSSGSPRDPGFGEGIRESLGIALDSLLARSGLQRAALFGARFGGTLAVELARRSPTADSLLLWGPYSSGDEFLRSARAMHRLVRANASQRKPRTQEAGDEELFGYLLDAETRAGIAEYRLLEIERAPCEEAHIIAWDEHSPENALAVHFRQLGVSVRFDRLESFRSDDSITHQAIPEPLFAQLIDDLDRSTPVDSEAETATPLRTSPSLVARVRRSARQPRDIEERVVWLGADGGIFGLHSDMPGAVGGRPGTRLLLVNGGNNHRAGINRNYTEWARDAALRGIPTLRFDIRGLGDSPALRAEDLNRLYRDETRADVLTAIDYLVRLGPGGRIVVCGLCAGAYQALHAALEDSRVDSLVLLDLLKWDPETPNVRTRGFLDRRARQLRRWCDDLRALLRLPFEPPSSSLAASLGELTDRGVDVLAVGCRGSGGLEEFVETLADDLARLEKTGRFRLIGLSDTDHIFSPIWAQEQLSEILMEVVDPPRPHRQSRTDCAVDTGTSDVGHRGV